MGTNVAGLLRTVSACVVALLLCCAVSAQTNTMTAREVLDRTAETYRSNSGGVQIGFTVSTADGESAGSIRLKGNKFVLDAGGLRTWYDGRTQWTYLEQTGEVNISEPAAAELQALNPYAWLDLYKQGYSLALDTATAVQGVYKVVMTTSDPQRRDLQSIVVMIDRTSFQPRVISIAGHGGRDVTVISIDTFLPRQDFPDSLFVFDRSLYPDAEVVDLR